MGRTPNLVGRTRNLMGRTPDLMGRTRNLMGRRPGLAGLRFNLTGPHPNLARLRTKLTAILINHESDPPLIFPVDQSPRLRGGAMIPSPARVSVRPTPSRRAA